MPLPCAKVEQVNSTTGAAPVKQPMTESSSPSVVEKYFKVAERGSSLLQEVRGGIVTFFSMVYILVLNPIILSGPDSTGAFLGGVWNQTFLLSQPPRRWLLELCQS